ncbi:hypothetical protein DPMN_123275 [Dreissena polymorpha]|uniref:Uncharacterized protein n=1 Tax=Dreissena polymorpha TaxID=45954 RepID=A0A9D4JRD4_DREPO|nr:hypothetical protein DPMN_123275 [Dreissena polymorpha]
MISTSSFPDPDTPWMTNEAVRLTGTRLKPLPLKVMLEESTMSRSYGEPEIQGNEIIDIYT